MFKAAKTVDFLFLTYYTDGSKQRKRLSSLIRLYFPLYLSRRSVSFSALRTERPINFLCRRRAAEWMIVMEKFDSLIIGEVAQDTNVDFEALSSRPSAARCIIPAARQPIWDIRSPSCPRRTSASWT